MDGKTENIWILCYLFWIVYRNKEKTYLERTRYIFIWIYIYLYIKKYIYNEIMFF